MYPPDAILEQFTRAFGPGVVQAFNEFLSRHPDQRDWVLASDYVWGEASRPQDVIAFTLYPDTVELSGLKTLFPRDFKKIKGVPDQGIEWFRGGAAFHICFVLNKGSSVFHSAGRDRRTVARESIAATLQYVRKTKAPPHWIEMYHGLEQLSHSSFNVRLWSDVSFLSLCYSFIVGLLARERRLDRLLWCSDRDNRTTWNDGVLYSLSLLQAVRYASHFRVRLDAANLPFLILGEDNSAQEYDHLVRPPDYLAGAIAAWNLKRGSTNEGAAKYGHVFRDILAHNTQIAILRTVMGDEHLHVTRLEYHLDGTAEGHNQTNEMK